MTNDETAPTKYKKSATDEDGHDNVRGQLFVLRENRIWLSEDTTTTFLGRLYYQQQSMF